MKAGPGHATCGILLVPAKHVASRLAQRESAEGQVTVKLVTLSIGVAKSDLSTYGASVHTAGVVAVGRPITRQRG